MKIISWNVAGIRAIIKKPEFINLLNNDNKDLPDIICLQETKAEETQVILNDEIKNLYNYRYWNSTKGTTQRKGLSGTCIWCQSPPIKRLDTPEFDEEGRILSLEFDNFILVNVYVPNSQKYESDRYFFRENWNKKFIEYLILLRKNKELIVCGDMNVAHNDIDISNPEKKKNKMAGFYDTERNDFTSLLEKVNLVDIFRNLYPLERKSTYWSNFLKAIRSNENGWRIDYFLISDNMLSIVKDYKILMDTYGSDHCPVLIEIK